MLWLLALIALPSIAATPTCTCDNRANALIAHARADYGAFCASWDAADEDPWCHVRGAESCGPAETFVGNKPGLFWSQAPCKGPPSGVYRISPLSSSAASTTVFQGIR